MKALGRPAERVNSQHIDLWAGLVKQFGGNHELRREIGAILGNAGVRPRATGLISRRGFGSEAP